LNNFEEKTYKLISREVEISNFEKWVYTEKELENLLTYDDYLELISLSYTTPSTLYEAEKILKKYIKIEKYHEWYLRRNLQKIIERQDNVHKYISQTYDMYCNGYYFLENLGLGYGLSIEVPPSYYNAQSWEDLKYLEQERLINSFYPAIRQEAKRVIYWLDSKKIVLTGHSGEYQGIEYEDNRTVEEKEATGYKCITAQKSKEITPSRLFTFLCKLFKNKG